MIPINCKLSRRSRGRHEKGNIPREGRRIASVRVSPGSYLAAASVLTFLSALVVEIRAGYLRIGLVKFCLADRPAARVYRSN